MRKIAIIIPTYNNLKGLINTLSSIRKDLRWSDEEYKVRIIIVESECTDGTNEFLNILSNCWSIIQVLHTKKEGSIKAINEGLINTNLDEDVYITHDDVIFPSMKSLNLLKEFFDVSQDETIGLIGTLDSANLSGPTYVNGLMWVGSWSLFIPRETLAKIGMFDDKMKIGEDIDYAYRVMKKGLKIWTIPIYLNHHQVRQTAHQNQSEEIKREASKYFKEKHGIK